MVRIHGFHPCDPGSSPTVGAFFVGCTKPLRAFSFVRRGVLFCSQRKTNNFSAPNKLKQKVFRFFSVQQKKCAGRESNLGLVRGRHLSYHWPTGAQVFSPRIELGTSRVLGERHNQLDHENVGVSGFRSQYLVLAKHARFRLRQYPTSLKLGGDLDLRM